MKCKERFTDDVINKVIVVVMSLLMSTLIVFNLGRYAMEKKESETKELSK